MLIRQPYDVVKILALPHHHPKEKWQRRPMARVSATQEKQIWHLRYNRCHQAMVGINLRLCS